MLESSDVADANNGVTEIVAAMGLISVATELTVGVMVANPPAGIWVVAVAVTVGVVVMAVEENFNPDIDADTVGATVTATVPAALRPTAAETLGVTTMVEPTWFSAHQPVIGNGGMSLVHQPAEVMP
jgi:hypothetical protein